MGHGMSAGSQFHNVRQEASVAVNVVWALNEAVRGAGAVLLGNGSMTAATANVDGGIGQRISLSELYKLCEDALAQTSDKALGLHWGERDFGRSLSVLPQVVLHAETLGQALEKMMRFSVLLTEDQPLQLLYQADQVILTMGRFKGASPAVHRMLVEFCFAGICRVIQAYQEDARPLRVCFDYAAPGYSQEYHRIFSDVVCFDESFSGIVLPRALLDVRPAHRDPGIYEAVHALAERRLSEMTAGAGYSTRAQRFLIRQDAPNRVSMQEVAKALDISVRSLHRRLAEEGTSYTEIAHAASGVVAKRLVNEGCSIKEAAFIMGFADPNSFHRAFKRWTGTTPGASR